MNMPTSPTHPNIVNEIWAFTWYNGSMKKSSVLSFLLAAHAPDVDGGYVQR